MQVEIKVLLGDTSDYHRLTSVLAPLLLSEESYEDYFFDFPSGSLTEEGSALRLRVPCAVPDGKTSPPEPSPSKVRCVTATNEAGLQNECPSLSPELNQGSELYRPPRPDVAATQTVMFHGFDTAPPPQPPQVPEASESARPLGRLVFKQRNTVEKGHQINFTVEDKHVPWEVVERLISKRENAFHVLRDYADHQEQLQRDGLLLSSSSSSSTSAASSVSAAGRIVERLRYIAQKLKEASGGSLHVSQDNECEEEENAAKKNKVSEDAEESNRYYGNVRYAAGAVSAASLSPSREERDRAQHINCDLVFMGSYRSTRKTYHYLQSQPGQCPSDLGGGPSTIFAARTDADGLTAEEPPQQDREWRSRLVIRIDKTLYPFGERYEIEVPRVDDSGCGGLLESVMEELTHFLTSLQIKYQFGSEGKYQRFIRGIRSLDAVPEMVQEVKLRLTNINGYNEVKRNLEQLMADGGGGRGPLSATQQYRQERGESASQKRRIATTDLDTSGTQSQPVCEAILDYTSSTERQENYFFDGPHGELAGQSCFLRLRRSTTVSDMGAAGKVRYVLTLKENNSFSQGTQTNRTSKTTLSADVARALLDDPTAWLKAHHDLIAVASALWNGFELRQLQPSASFSTERITVPWWSAQCQRMTAARMRGGAPASVSPTFFPPPEGGDTQPRRHGRAGSGGAAMATVPPLLIHLDRSRYQVTAPNAAKRQRVPFSTFSMSQAGGDGGDGGGGGGQAQTFELYEVEVTNITSAAPSTVMEELTAVLDGMGVEWQTGVQSKLSQYYTLLRMASS